MKPRCPSLTFIISFALFASSPSGAHAIDLDVTPYAMQRSPHLESGFHFVVREGLTGGGDTLASITQANGVKRDIDAGGLYQIALGSRFQFSDTPLSLELNLGFQFDRDDYESDEAQFRRTPLEGIIHLNLSENLSIGAGARSIYSPSATITRSGITEWIRFRDARGSIAELGYHINPYGWIALRYVREDYVVENHTSTSSTTPPIPPARSMTVRI